MKTLNIDSVQGLKQNNVLNKNDCVHKTEFNYFKFGGATTFLSWYD